MRTAVRFLALVALSSASAAAENHSIEAAGAEPEEAEEAAKEGSSGTAGKDPNGVTASWRLQVAPTLGDPLPLNLGDGLKDYKNVTELSVTLKAPLPLGQLETSLGLRASTNLNDSEKNGSSLFITNEFYFNRGHRRFSPFVYVSAESGYSQFFKDNGEEILEYGAGSRIQLVGRAFAACPLRAQDFCFGSDPKSQHLVLDLRLLRSESSLAPNDFWGPKASLDFLQKFASTRAVLSLKLEYQHKRFNEPAGDRRRDDQLVGTATVDLARVLFPKSLEIRNLKLGGRWTRSWSNHPDGRANKLQFLPVLAIGTTFGK